MKVINSKTDKFLISCIELDLYDLLYQASIPQKQNWNLNTEIDLLMANYKSSGAIRKFNIVVAKSWAIVVDIYTPRKIKITCKMP